MQIEVVNLSLTYTHKDSDNHSLSKVVSILYLWTIANIMKDEKKTQTKDMRNSALTTTCLH